ncbi:MAG: 2-oxoacid:acceptor oxidoreductase subunit alpha, partial [Thermoanaerobaculia bacterium]|nr:2-oxoacid:acceptor oxidoreductase subunit alpha [Thermoanaerobaculia bacterium]
RERLEELEGKWSRYLDVDGDAVPWRTLPGTDHPDASYFTRGSGHNEHARYSERPPDYTNLIDRLKRKEETAKEVVPAPIVENADGAKIGIIAFGSSDPAVRESVAQLKKEQDLPASYLRLRAIPFTEDVHRFIEEHDRLYVVEQNRDGQMATLLRSAAGENQRKIRSVLHYDGLPVYARFVTDAIVEAESREERG